MKKGVMYFFNLWGRNFFGHFRSLGNVAPKFPVGTLFVLIFGLPVIALSPIASLIKTVVDYRTRKLLSEDKLVQLKGQRNSLEERISALSDGAVKALVQAALAYKSKSMSRATRDMKVYLMASGETDSIDQVKHKFMLYLANPKNIAKGFYNLVVEQVLKQSNVQETMPAEPKAKGANPYAAPKLRAQAPTEKPTPQPDETIAFPPVIRQ